MHSPWHVAEFVALLAVGIAALQALVWIPIILWWRRKSHAAAAQLAAAIESETVLRTPEKAVYRGATVPGYPRVANNGTIALTGRRLIFMTITGRVFEISADEITGVRESRVFTSSVRGGRPHLVVQTGSGEVAFYVSCNPDWIHAITAVATS